MPPKAKFTREEIVQAALSLARRQGLQAVTAREVASRLGTSTRPIFTYFRTMKELRQAVAEAARQVYGTYIQKGLREPVPFWGVGMQYLQFARQEPRLYQALFLSNTAETLAGLGQLQQLIRNSIMQTYQIDEAAAALYSRDMWLVAHSLATLTVTGSCPYTDEQAGQILTRFSLAICKAIKEIPGYAQGSCDPDRAFQSLLDEPKP